MDAKPWAGINPINLRSLLSDDGGQRSDQRIDVSRSLIQPSSV